MSIRSPRLDQGSGRNRALGFSHAHCVGKVLVVPTTYDSEMWAYIHCRNNLVIFLFVPAVLGLTCLTCWTTISCNASTTSSQTCAPAFDRCGKVYTKVAKVETFAKKCLVKEKSVKEENTTCQAAFGTMECEVRCCYTDDCNAGPTFRISGTLLLACALASLIILVKSWHWRH